MEIEPSHRERTAFTVGPLGFYQYCRMPFGLTNSPATFQRMMERVLSGVHLKSALCYLDDVIVFGRTIEELLKRLDEVFKRIEGAGLKLKKCHMFHRKLKYLGHIVSGDGVECDPEMIEPVKSWKVPENVKELQRFLGFANFYRKFIKGFGAMAAPLTALTGGTKKVDKRRKKDAEQQWKWGEEQQEAFDKLRQALTSSPVLGYPDFTKPFLVRTDASTSGLGAVLCQDQGDRAGPVVLAYASRSLKPSEKNYSPYKLEFLAMYWAITKKFSQYLSSNDRQFTLTTDHNPLTYVLTKAKVDAAGHRWLAELMQYSFCIKYKPGVANIDADALSRMHEETISAEAVRAICTALCEQDDDDWEGYAQCIFVNAPAVTAHSMRMSAGPQRPPMNWKEEQGKDPILCRLRKIVEGLVVLDERRELPAIKRWMKESGKLQLKDGILYRQPQGRPRQILLPSHVIGLVLNRCHGDMGHQGRDRTMSLCRLRFYWLGMAKHVEEFISSCERCRRGKAPHLPHRAPLQPILSTEPLDLVCIDFLGLETSKGGYNSILVMTDHYTKWAMAIPTRNQKASTVAKLLQEHLFYTIGIPRRLHSDCGGSFEAQIIKHLCSAHGVQKSRTSPYHPEGDGITERYNRTLLGMLRTLDGPQKEDWKSHVSRLAFAYNCTEHASTGFSPYYLMHGRHPVCQLIV